MFIKNFDYLSPHITFYHQGLLSHSSIISGIISIISIILIIILAIYFSLDIIKKEDPKIFSYNSLIEDAGTFPLNASSLFHFISMVSLSTNYANDGFDFTLFRIIGLETYYEVFLYVQNLSNYDHWLYGKCNNQTDTKGISHLISFDFFEKSACIRKYFNKNEQKYYNTDDPKFRWPVISHGINNNNNNQAYNIIIDKCKNNTINLILGDDYQCKNFLEYEQLFINYSVYGEMFFYLINTYIDILNYENPYKKYFFLVSSFLNKNEYIINNLNFNPSVVRTHNGLIFDNIEEQKTYYYEKNEIMKSF